MSTDRIKIGIFENVADAERAVEDLIAAGFTRDRLSVVCPQCDGDEGELDEIEDVPRAGENTPAAAGAGGAIGAVLGGLTAAALAIGSGGVGLLIAGPLLLGGAAGGVTGSFIGAMTTRGFEPEIADYYDQALQRGQVLVAVEAETDDERATLGQAVPILQAAGGKIRELEHPS